MAVVSRYVMALEEVVPLLDRDYTTMSLTTVAFTNWTAAIVVAMYALPD